MPSIKQNPKFFKLNQKIVSGNRKYWFSDAFATKVAAEQEAKYLRSKNVTGIVRTPSEKLQKKNCAIVRKRESNKGYPWIVYISG